MQRTVYELYDQKLPKWSFRRSTAKLCSRIWSSSVRTRLSDKVKVSPKGKLGLVRHRAFTAPNSIPFGAVPGTVAIRVLERMGVETSQLTLARCVMRGVLGRERSRGRTVEKWRVKTKFCSTYNYKVHCYRWTVRYFSLPFGSGHLYTICKLSVLNNRIIVSQIKVNICEIN